MTEQAHFQSQHEQLAGLRERGRAIEVGAVALQDPEQTNKAQRIAHGSGRERGRSGGMAVDGIPAAMRWSGPGTSGVTTIGLEVDDEQRVHRGLEREGARGRIRPRRSVYLMTFATL